MNVHDETAVRRTSVDLHDRPDEYPPSRAAIASPLMTRGQQWRSRWANEVTVMADVAHTAARPSWDCRACGTPWPCEPARETLVAEMNRVDLAIFMWANLDEAESDMPAGPSAEFYERFIRWTH